jgi:single-strand DNA-binding protein
MSCLVEGRLSIRSYETKEGEKRKATEVVCNNMQMLDRAGAGGGARMNGDGGESYERSPAPARNGAPSTSHDEDEALDEIPF